MKIQKLITCLSLLCSSTCAFSLSAAEPISHMTLLQLCEELPHQASAEQFQVYEQCTKQTGPMQIAQHFAEIYQKTAGKVSLKYIDNTVLVLEDFVEDDPARYQSSSLWGCDASQRYCVILQAGWESWRYLLVDRKTKLTFELDGAPVFSPDSLMLFEYLDSRISENFSYNIIKLYRLDEAKPTLLMTKNDSNFGVQSAKWLTATRLEAKLQQFAGKDYSRYVDAGTMQLRLEGKEVKVTVENAK